MIEATDSALLDGLRASLAVDRWVAAVAAAAPFDSLDALLDAADAAARPLRAEEIEAAIAHHPRIGESPQGGGVAQSLSRAEQASPDAADPALAAALAAGNAAYEAKFGRVFLIRAAGRARAQILAELERRLSLDAASELDIVGEQLREIALVRLRTIFGEKTP